MHKFMATLTFLWIFIIFTNFSAMADQYGETYDEQLPSKKINTILNDPGAIGKKYSFQGTVSAQCKADGCWFKLRDDTGEILVDLKPYNFRLPPDIVGKKVKLNGIVNSSKNGLKVDAVSVRDLK